eukprot:GGOE01040596.1.p1 GENE.GGOE01040596.1~~GGOE01040596.1.p1  ORF type:complete len:412 (+),score=110.61 GGOE01040596.1:44-1237(+)
MSAVADGGEQVRTFTDDGVCKEYLVAGVCLPQLFEGTGVLSGKQRKGCPKVHDDAFRRQYVMAPNRRSFPYDADFYERVSGLISIANDRCKAERKKAKAQGASQDVLCETCGLVVLPHMMEAHLASRTHKGYLELRRLQDERAGKVRPADAERDPKRQRANSPSHEVAEFVRVRAPLVESTPGISVTSPTSEPSIMPLSAGRAGELHNLRLLVRLLNTGQPVPDELYAAVNAHRNSPKAVLESRISQLRREGVVEASSSSITEQPDPLPLRRSSRKEADYYVVDDLTRSNSRGFWVSPLPHHFNVTEASAIFSHFGGLQEVRMPKRLKSLKGDLRPIAYLTFHTPELATVALEAIDGIFIRYERIRASVACPVKQPVEQLLADANVGAAQDTPDKVV